MTYYVSSGTLNPTHSLTLCYKLELWFYEGSLGAMLPFGSLPCSLPDKVCLQRKCALAQQNHVYERVWLLRGSVTKLVIGLPLYLYDWSPRWPKLQIPEPPMVCCYVTTLGLARCLHILCLQDLHVFPLCSISLSTSRWGQTSVENITDYNKIRTRTICIGVLLYWVRIVSAHSRFITCVPTMMAKHVLVLSASVHLCMFVSVCLSVRAKAEQLLIGIWRNLVEIFRSESFGSGGIK